MLCVQLPGIYLADSIAVILILLTLLKAGEMKYHKRLVDREVKDPWQHLPITRVMGKVPVLHWLLFKLPTLTIALTIVGFNTRTPVISWMVGGSLLAILWFLIGRMMYDLLHQGTNRYLVSLGAPNFTRSPKKNLRPHERIRTFVMALIGYVSQGVLGYAAVFHICHLQFNKMAFTGIPKDGFEFFYFIYYSLVTFGTVGYGDVYPAAGSPDKPENDIFMRILTRTFVGSEICLSFVVVAVFIASFSLAFGQELENDDNRRGLRRDLPGHSPRHKRPRRF